MRIKGFKAVKLRKRALKRLSPGCMRLRVELETASGKMAELYTFPEKLSVRITYWLRAHIRLKFPTLNLAGCIKSGFRATEAFHFE